MFIFNVHIYNVAPYAHSTNGRFNFRTRTKQLKNTNKNWKETKSYTKSCFLLFRIIRNFWISEISFPNVYTFTDKTRVWCVMFSCFFFSFFLYLRSNILFCIPCTRCACLSLCNGNGQNINAHNMSKDVHNFRRHKIHESTHSHSKWWNGEKLIDLISNILDMLVHCTENVHVCIAIVMHWCRCRAVANEQTKQKAQTKHNRC